VDSSSSSIAENKSFHGDLLRALQNTNKQNAYFSPSIPGVISRRIMHFVDSDDGIFCVLARGTKIFFSRFAHPFVAFGIRGIYFEYTPDTKSRQKSRGFVKYGDLLLASINTTSSTTFGEVSEYIHWNLVIDSKIIYVGSREERAREMVLLFEEIKNTVRKYARRVP
jgi:hypothetical protein